MTDSEFLALSPTEAYDYAVGQEPAERVRLLKLYRETNGQEAHRSLSGASVETRFEAPTSKMLTIGRAGFIVSLIVIGLVILLALGGTGFFFGLTLLLPAASLIGLFACMWMIGALEMRLIEINQTLNRKLGG